MTDDELTAQAPSLPVLYFDGFGAFKKSNGVLRCIGYTLAIGGQYNLIISLAGADLANREGRRVLDESPTKCLHIWSGLGLAH